MKRYDWKRWIALLLAMILLCLAVGCEGQQKQENDPNNLMNGIKPAKQGQEDDDCDCAPVEPETLHTGVTDFAVRLFQNCMEEEKNTLISPVSVLTALAMTANGADGETLSQMETVFGMPVQELNGYIRDYMAQLPEEDAYKLSMANSIWFTDDEQLFQVDPDFLQTNANYYGADVYKAPFDETTLDEINGWVKRETDDMIPTILDRIPEDAIMYLVNALAFDAKWQEPYEEYQVREGRIFTLEDGTETEVTMMNSEEYGYLEDELATGFIKYYDDRAYAFVALLPNEGVTVSEYVASLDGQHLREMLTSVQGVTVLASMPKFESEYDVEMSGILAEMGMPNAFDWEVAEFPHIGTVSDGLNIVISRVIHKTFISVTENGTQAGAATVVEMRAEGAMDISEFKEVTLDRPFVYMLIDCENDIPLFIGSTMSVE